MDAWCGTSSRKLQRRPVTEEDGAEHGQDDREEKVQGETGAHHGALANLTGAVDDRIGRRGDREHEGAGRRNCEGKDKLRWRDADFAGNLVENRDKKGRGGGVGAVV